MKIFVKSSNRACALDRCLWSIGENVSGHDGIVVLDDGIEERFLERIADKHKKAEFRRSPHGVEKQSIARETCEDLHKQFVERGWDPAQFWHREIVADAGAYITVAEEDCWFQQPLDLASVEENLINRNTVLLSLRTNTHDDVSKLQIFADKLPGSLTLNYYQPVIQGLHNVGTIFPTTMAVYRREYWCHAVGKLTNFLMEIHAITGAVEYLSEAQMAGELLRFATTHEWIGRQSDLTTSRTDGGGIGIDLKIKHADYNQAVDEAWLRGEFNSLSGYPSDWPIALLEDVYRDQLGKQRTEEWVAWQKSYGKLNAHLRRNKR